VVDTGPQSEASLPLDDDLHGVQQSVVVGAAAARCTGRQHELPTVAIDVALEERHAVRHTRLLDVAHALVERLDRSRGAAALQYGIGSRELDERDRHRTVLRFAGCLEQVSTHWWWQQRSRVDVGIRCVQNGDVGNGRGRPQQPPTRHRCTDRRPR
jgi:hypothetical protein